MAIFLDWFASHNTLVIQSLAAIVALLIVVLIFRLLFANQQAAAEGLTKDVTFTQLEEKLNKLLEQQSQMKVSVNAVTEGAGIDGLLGADAMAALSGDPEAAAAAAAAGAATATTATEQVAELSRLRAEISTLKDSLKRKEVEITSAKEQAVQSVNTDQQDAKLADLSGKITDYEKEIEALKNRLSDYEIIAEDIADLQAYKKENQYLKNQLANQQPAPVATAPAQAEAPAPVEVEPTPEPLVEAVPEPEPEIEEPKAEVVTEAATDEMDALMNEDVAEEPIVPDDILTAANDALSDMPAAEAQSEEMPEVTGPDELDNEETREVSKDVKKEDKSLLDEFEKHFAKDED